MPAPTGTAQLSCAVLDDDPIDLERLSRLTRNTKIRLFTFQCPEALHEDLRHAHFDALILDERMGATSGLEVYETVRKAGWDGPIVLLTGSGDEYLVANAFRTGFADYLRKGDVNSSSLERAIVNAVEKSRLERKLKDKTQELAQRVQQLAKSNAEIRRVYHHLSHELKTPLTSAREFVSIVHDEFTSDVPEMGRELLVKALRNCDQLAVHMNDLLDVTKVDTGKATLKLDRHPIADLVDLVAADHGSSCKAKGLQLQVETLDPRLSAVIDDQRVFQIISNLVSNAVKFTPEGGLITISVGRDLEDPDMLSIAVTDTGRGIAAADLDCIFERLRQTRKDDSAVEGGLGIGLYLCRELAVLHGGTVSVASVLGEGSTFTVTLPLDGPVPNESLPTECSESSPLPDPDPMSPIAA